MPFYSYEIDRMPHTEKSVVVFLFFMAVSSPNIIIDEKLLGMVSAIYGLEFVRQVILSIPEEPFRRLKK